MHAVSPVSAKSLLLAVACILALLASCSGGGGGGASVAPPPALTTTDLDADEDPPGVEVVVTGLTGASGSDGSFQTGDRISVHFTLKQKSGAPWGVAEMDLARALVSGPTFNYQRVIAEQSDLKARAVHHGGGNYSYTFDDPLPARYLRPFNDSPSFGASDGELAGQPLLAGTYTVGLSFVWKYTVASEPFLDVGETAADFRFAGATALTPRQVTTLANCNQCHARLEAHDGTRRNVTLCLMCHTTGAEDRNDPNVAGGTPGVTINSRVMFHKLHNARHLPSVLGVGTKVDGSRDYTQTPRPYVLVDEHLVAKDFSSVGFPVWPNRTVPMPRDFEYSQLGPAQRAQEDEMLRGITKCLVCHGDPDGAGPLQAPAQGDLVNVQPSRAACGACHDDVDWTRFYVSNGASMDPVQTVDDSLCNTCHERTNGTYAVIDTHTHPLLEKTTGQFFANDIHFDLRSVSEAGTANQDGRFDPGEKIALSFAVTDDTGADVDASTLKSITAVLSGPTRNSNLVLQTEIPTQLLGFSQPFTINLPELRQLELLGHSSGANGDVFATAFAPHLLSAQTKVLVRQGTAGGSSSLVAATAAPANFVDVANASGFDRGDFLVIDDGVAGFEEYAQIQFVDGSRLWFSSPQTPSFAPGLARVHAAGAQVLEVSLQQKTQNQAYALVPATGTITELQEFGAGAAVLASYWTDFVVPQTYPLSANDSPDLDETFGEWTGKSLVDGTYRISLWGNFEKQYFPPGQPINYLLVSPAASQDLLVGSAAAIEPYDLISSKDNCYACHQDFWFHDGTVRGFDACIACHGNAGAEDRPRYVAANAPATPGVTVNFRTMVHKIHRGSQLQSPFSVIGSGPAPYPDNFTANSYAKILFPAMPGATQNCEKCHGIGNTAWIIPADRNHPTQQTQPVQAWKAACGTCHDSAQALGHIGLQTTPAGLEVCGVCHDPGRANEVELSHKVR